MKLYTKLKLISAPSAWLNIHVDRYMKTDTNSLDLFHLACWSINTAMWCKRWMNNLVSLERFFLRASTAPKIYIAPYPVYLQITDLTLMNCWIIIVWSKAGPMRCPSRLFIQTLILVAVATCLITSRNYLSITWLVRMSCKASLLELYLHLRIINSFCRN
jgi:hypothetical protein